MYRLFFKPDEEVLKVANQDDDEDLLTDDEKCHTRFPKRNQMHLICVPGSSSTHMIDEMSVIS
jgi:hypothetical protein